MRGDPIDWGRPELASRKQASSWHRMQLGSLASTSNHSLHREALFKETQNERTQCGLLIWPHSSGQALQQLWGEVCKPLGILFTHFNICSRFSFEKTVANQPLAGQGHDSLQLTLGFRTNTPWFLLQCQALARVLQLVLTHGFSPQPCAARTAVTTPTWQTRKPWRTHIRPYLAQVHSLSAKPGRYSMSGSWMLSLWIRKKPVETHTQSERCCLNVFSRGHLTFLSSFPFFSSHFSENGEKAQQTR